MKLDGGTIYLLVAAGALGVSVVRSPTKTKQALLATARISLIVIPVLFLIFVLMGTIEASASSPTAP